MNIEKFFKDIVARTSASIWMKTEIWVKIIYIFLLNYDIFVILHIARDLKPLALQLWPKMHNSSQFSQYF